MGVCEPNDGKASLQSGPPGESAGDLTKAESDSEVKSKKSAFSRAADEDSSNVFLGRKRERTVQESDYENEGTSGSDTNARLLTSYLDRLCL
jgi:hypothetical protein